MNDTTRELGSALGIAVLGSIAATHYSNAVSRSADSALSGTDAASAKVSLANALEHAAKLPTAAGQTLTKAADQAYIGGLHLAVLVGGVLASGAAVLVLKLLPRTLMHRGGTRQVLDAAVVVPSGDFPSDLAGANLLSSEV